MTIFRARADLPGRAPLNLRHAFALRVDLGTSELCLAFEKCAARDAVSWITRARAVAAASRPQYHV
jgi:hypothetical protein